MTFVQTQIYGQRVGAKVLVPGRVVVLDIRDHRNTPAVVLQPIKDQTMKVLVLCSASNDQPTNDDVVDDELPRPVVERYLAVPVGAASHRVVSVTVEDIAVVSDRLLKINADKIIDDVKKREQPRFK